MYSELGDHETRSITSMDENAATCRRVLDSLTTIDDPHVYNSI